MVSWIDRRETIINMIVNTLIKSEGMGLVLDDKLFVNEICSDCGCAERKAKEYLKIAKLRKEKRVKEFETQDLNT